VFVGRKTNFVSVNVANVAELMLNLVISTEVPVEVQLVDLGVVSLNVLLALCQELCEVLKCWF